MDMKKVLNLLLSLSVAGCLVSCGDLLEIPDVQGTQEQPVQPVAPSMTLSGDVVFTATWESLSDGSQPVWEGADKILLSDGTSVQTLINKADAGVVAQFPGRVADGATAIFAVTPASDAFTISGQKVSFTLPAEQTPSSVPAAGVAKSSGAQLFFRPLLSEIAFTVGFEGATKVVFKADKPLAGAIEVDYGGENPVVTATSDQVAVSGNFVKGERYSFTVLPVEIDSYSVEVYVGDQVKAHISGDEVQTKVGLETELPGFTADIPTYRVVAMKLWGGTGPEWDCTKVYDILQKPGCFNNEDGRGIEAIKDNYFLMKEDGTFVNYAGEDGRNWWFVYSGEQNPANGKDVDLRAFYDLLPLSEGTWSYADGKVTFNRPNAGSTTATWVPAGTYDMPGTSPQLSVTIEKEALMFAIQGGKDNWDFPWQDYGVIACHPRALFIEIEKMPDGFVVPEASRTFDADFEYIPPVEPDALFDWDGFEAHWNVYGGNSAPYGISVLGGSGDDPAFVSPIDKSWDWSDSIWKESDNGLVVKVSSRTDTEIKGTTNWWSGDDGGFWDYVWKGTGESLAHFYDQIPKGEKEFTLDLTTMTITLGNGHVAKFLTPGTHEFVFGRTWEVPDGCFAFAFHLMDPIDATSSRWTDVDRFVYAPLEYVIMFEK